MLVKLSPGVDYNKHVYTQLLHAQIQKHNKTVKWSVSYSAFAICTH